MMTLDDKICIRRDQFNALANDALMNSELNNFFAEGIRIMLANDLAYSDFNLINLYLKKNSLPQLEICDV